MDRLQSMRVFAKVVEQGSFARAGQALDISNAVVTRHVADLEGHLGTRLLNRTTRKLSLTETGRAYLERVNRILQDIDDAEALAASDSQKPAGMLRIYALLGFGKEQLARLLPAYARANPDVVLDVTLSERTADLVEEGFDVGIFSGLQKFDAGMVVRQLGVAEVLMCASPDYVKRHGAPKTPQEVSRHACLNFSHVEILRNHWPMMGPKSTVNIPIRSRMLSNNGDLLRHCAAAGMGIIVSPSFTLSEDLASKRLVRLLPKYHLGQMAIMLVYPSRRQVPAKVRSFIDYMSAQFPKPQSDPWSLP